MPNTFRRPFSKTTTRRALLASQSVTQWNGWDVSLPNAYVDKDVVAFSAGDLAEFEDEVMRRLAPLLPGAVDSAHGAILDKTTAAVFAPVYEHAWETHHLNLRSLEALDGQGRNTAHRLAEEAAHMHRLAHDANAEADGVYQEYVHLPRDARTRTAWSVGAAEWEAIRLTLAPDFASSTYSTFGFRGGSGLDPAATGAQAPEENLGPDGNVTPLRPRPATPNDNDTMEEKYHA